MFGERLKLLRKLKNKKQYEIAIYLGVSAQAYGHYESGRRQPDPNIIAKLADYFGVTTDYLLCRTDSPDLAIPKEMEGIGLHFSNSISVEGLKADQIEDVMNYIDYIKYKKNNEGNNYGNT